MCCGLPGQSSLMKQQWFVKTVANLHEFFLRPKGGLLIAYTSINPSNFEYCLCASFCTKPFLRVTSLNVHSDPRRLELFSSLCSDEETQVQRDPHSK